MLCSLKPLLHVLSDHVSFILVEFFMLLLYLDQIPSYSMSHGGAHIWIMLCCGQFITSVLVDENTPEKHVTSILLHEHNTTFHLFVFNTNTVTFKEAFSHHPKLNLVVIKAALRDPVCH